MRFANSVEQIAVLSKILGYARNAQNGLRNFIEVTICRKSAVVPIRRFGVKKATFCRVKYDILSHRYKRYNKVYIRLYLNICVFR